MLKIMLFNSQTVIKIINLFKNAINTVWVVIKIINLFKNAINTVWVSLWL